MSMRYLPTTIVLLVASAAALFGITGCEAMPEPSLAKVNAHVGDAQQAVAKAETAATDAQTQLRVSQRLVGQAAKQSQPAEQAILHVAGEAIGSASSYLEQIVSEHAKARAAIDAAKAESAEQVTTANSIASTAKKRAKRAEATWGYRLGKHIDEARAAVHRFLVRAVWITTLLAIVGLVLRANGFDLATGTLGKVWSGIRWLLNLLNAWRSKPTQTGNAS